MKENIKINQRNYAKRRFLNTGIKSRCLYLTDNQLKLVKVFVSMLKKIENLNNLIGLDVSEDYSTMKLVFKGGKNDDTAQS